MASGVGRFPLFVSIFTPALTRSALKTAVTNLATLQAGTSGVILIQRQDQLNPAQLTIKEVYQNNTTQASSAPYNKTKTGLEASLRLELSKDNFTLFSRSFNATVTPGAAASGNNPPNPSLANLTDDGGLTAGEDIPFSTVIMQPYQAKAPNPDPQKWFIFPFAGLEGDATISYGLTTQFTYNIMVTAYADPVYGDAKVLRGDTSLLTP